MANKYIPENIEHLFIPDINEDVKKAATDCTVEELVILVNNLVDVINRMLKEQKGQV